MSGGGREQFLTFWAMDDFEPKPVLFAENLNLYIIFVGSPRLESTYV